MTLGLIARADDGGLGALTWEAHRHLRPERTLIVLTGHMTRGRADLARYVTDIGRVRSCRGFPGRNDIAWLLTGIDALYTAETWYSPGIYVEAKQRGIRTILHAMPEMHGAADRADQLLVPTTWRHDLVAGADVLPVPVALDRFMYRPRTRCREIYHVSSDAMCDRNGTHLLLAALPLMREAVNVTIRGGPRQADARHSSGTTVRWLPHYLGPYWEAWPKDADVLVMPRRFGGLCLPMQEAAAQGVPIVSLDLEPQRQWIPREALVRAEPLAEGVRMKGGAVNTHECDPAELAARLDELTATPTRVAALSDSAYEWAQSIAWPALQERYEAVLAPQ